MTGRKIPLVVVLLVMRAAVALGAEHSALAPAGGMHADPPEPAVEVEQRSATDEHGSSPADTIDSAPHEDVSSGADDTAPRAGPAAVSEIQSTQQPDIISDIRALYSLQDAAAAGHREAATFQKVMLQQIDRKLAERMPGDEPDVLVQSVVGFVLSGGNPLAADRLAEREDLSALHRKLLRGASLYMRGKREEASGLLAEIDALLLQPSIAGRVALVQAMLETRNEERRQALLAVAIASMPGSLVEESALRRSALSYAGKGRQHLFWKRAIRYLRRFPHSIYAKPFLHDVMNGILKLESDKAMPDRLQIDTFLTQIPQPDRRTLYLSLARQAALRNHVDLTKFASRRSLRLSVPGSQEAQIARLYSLIFEVTSEGPVDANDGLRNLNRELLPPLEQRILEASLAVVGAIREPAAVSSAGTALQDNGEEALELQKTAQLSLASADKGIEESSR